MTWDPFGVARIGSILIASDQRYNKFVVSYVTLEMGIEGLDVFSMHRK